MDASQENIHHVCLLFDLRLKRVLIIPSFWQMATDSIAPAEASELAEDLGIEYDTSEHEQLERSTLCDLKANSRRK